MVGFTGLGSYNSSTAVENIDALYLRKGGTNDSTVSIALASAGGDSYFVGARIKHIRTGSNSNGHLAFETKSDSSTNTTTERMRIQSNGNILFKGQSTTSLAEAIFQNTNSALNFFATDTTSFSKDIGFFTDTTTTEERLRISSNGLILISAFSAGNVMIGVSSDSGDRLRVTGGNGNTFTDTITTLRPDTESKSSAWRLGLASSGTITPDRLIRVMVDGIEYNIPAREA
jgi:hypothetical protein